MNISNYIKNNLLLKVASANTIVVFIRMFFSVITQKALAILIGAEGIALVGNLKNVISFFEQFSILGTSNGLVKYISQHKADKERLNQLFSTVFVLSAFASVVSFIVLFFLPEALSSMVFGADENYSYIFKILAFLIPFMGVNAILYSLLNGLSAYKLFSKINLIVVIAGAILIVLFTFEFGLTGSLLAICFIPFLQFLIYIIFFRKNHVAYIELRKISFNLKFKNHLLSYSLMTVVVLFFINVTDIAIRNLIEYKINVEEAGYWTAMVSISKTYMQFTAAIFPLYVLPVYAKINDTLAFRNEVKKIYKMLLPLLFVGMLLVFIFRDLIIKLLYTSDFLSMSSLFKWQLLGDFIKFIAFVLSYQFIAKKQIAYFIFTELLSVIMFYIFSNYFINTHGTEGVVIAHFVRYVIYLVVVVYILRHNFIGSNRTFKR